MALCLRIEPLAAGPVNIKALLKRPCHSTAFLHGSKMKIYTNLSEIMINGEFWEWIYNSPSFTCGLHHAKRSLMTWLTYEWQWLRALGNFSYDIAQICMTRFSEACMAQFFFLLWWLMSLEADNPSKIRSTQPLSGAVYIYLCWFQTNDVWLQKSIVHIRVTVGILCLIPKIILFTKWLGRLANWTLFELKADRRHLRALCKWLRWTGRQTDGWVLPNLLSRCFAKATQSLII